jgi:transcriptional regulator with XRE-family HTH domain
MIVDTIKNKMDKIGLKQKELAELLTKITGKYYNQSMISKRLNDDKNITYQEIQLITDAMNEYIKINNIKIIKSVSFIKIVGGK